MQRVKTSGVTEVGKRIWRISVPLSADMRPTTVNVYVIEDSDGGAHVIDTGWDTDRGWRALAQGMRQIGHQVEEIRTVTVTHLHRDHRGLAERIRLVSGAPVAMHKSDVAAQLDDRGVVENELNAWAVPVEARRPLLGATPAMQPPTTVDRLLEDDNVLEIPGRVATIVHTPGHTPGSVCIALPAERIVLTGDHVLPDQFPGIGLGGAGLHGENHVHEYQRSLERLMVMENWLALPGHGDCITNLPALVQKILRHHVGRSSEVLRVQSLRPHATVWEIAQSLTWGSGWEGLSPWHRISALRQTEMHLAAARIHDAPN